MSLVAWYPLNGDTLDYSGNGNHATNNSQANITVNNNGKIGKCYNFTGISYLSSVKSVSLPILTYTAWVKWNSSASSIKGIVNNFRHTGVNGYNISFCVGSNGILRIDIPIKDGTSHKGFYATSVIPSGIWVHVAVSFNTVTGEYCFYVNGVVDKKGVISGASYIPVNVVPEKLMIGQWGWSYSSTYKYIGDINDVRIYNHALSEKEIKEIAKAKILHYTFDDFQEPTENILIGGEVPVTSSSYGIKNYYFSTPMIENETYTISLKGTLGEGKTYFGIYNSGDSVSFVSLRPSDLDDDGVFRKTFTGKVGTSSNTFARAYHMPSSTVVESTIEWIQIEKKDHSTPFTPDTREGVVRDISGYRNDATLDLTTAPTWTDGSRIGTGAYKFNGTQNITTSQIFFDNVNQCHTVSAWIFPTNPSIIGNQQLLNFNLGYRIYHSAGSKSLMYNNSGINDHYVYGSIIPTNQWTLITWVYDKQNLICRVYYDGVLNAVSSNMSSSDVPSGFSTSTILGTNFYGYIDDVRIYATALSEEDITELYKTRASLDDKGNLYINGVDGHTNLFNGNFNDGFIDLSTGELGYAAGYPNSIYSDLIEVSEGNTYICSGHFPTDMRYRMFKADVSYYGSGSSSGVYTIPPTVKYVRLLWYQGLTEESKSNIRFDNYDGLTVNLTDKGILKGNISEVGITDGLIAYYPLDGNAKDYSGNNYHGTIGGAPIQISGVKSKTAYNFKATGDKITVPDITSPILTLGVWHKWDETSTTWRSIFANSGNFHHMSFNSSRVLGLWDGGHRTFGYTIYDNEWHNYVMIITSATSALLYVDGVFVGQTSTTLNLATYPIQVIGNWGSNSYPGGNIDEVRIYNRALTAEEIALQYDLYKENFTKMKIRADKLYVPNQIKEV